MGSEQEDAQHLPVLVDADEGRHPEARRRVSETADARDRLNVRERLYRSSYYAAAVDSCTHRRQACACGRTSCKAVQHAGVRMDLMDLSPPSDLHSLSSPR